MFFGTQRAGFDSNRPTTPFRRNCTKGQFSVTEHTDLARHSAGSGHVKLDEGIWDPMKTACSSCGAAHSLPDASLVGHARVQFRCAKCGKSTQVEVAQNP